MKKTPLYVCDNNLPELLFIIEKLGLSGDFDVKPFSSDGCSGQGTTDLNSYPDLMLNDEVLPLVFYCNTCSFLKAFSDEGKSDQCISYASFFELLTNQESIKKYTDERCYLVSSGWLRNWQSRIMEMGFHGEEVRGFFNDFCDRIVFIDIINSNEDAEHLKAFSEYLGIPYLIHKADLNHPMKEIGHILYKRAYEDSLKHIQSVEKQCNRHLAEYGMIFDLMKNISALTELSEVVESINGICRMLFDPADVTIHLSSDEFPVHISEFVDSSLVYAVHSDKTGFMFKILNKNATLAIVDLMDIKCPQYIERYINTAVSISETLGLGLMNAINFERIISDQENFDAVIDKVELLGSIGFFQFDWTRGHEFISNGLYRLLKRDESLPLSYRDILGQLDSRDRKTVLKMVSDSRSSEKELELKVRDFTGGVRIISCIIENKTGPDGNRETTTGFCHDITEYKSMQERLRIKSHIDSIGTLASGYAHEINNPLNGIMNYAQLIIDENTGMEGLDEYAGEIIREGERISRITGSLIARSSQMSESIQNCMIEKAIKRALDNLHGLIEESGIVINVVGNDIEHITKGYCSGLANVFIEVLKNSIRALNEKYQGSDYNGTITIETSMADTESGRKIRLSISDDGTGISDKDLERVFDPFFSTYPKDMAMGMGLTNVYTTIQRNNGDVWLRSEYGKYTEVIIQLPYEPSGS